MNHQSSSRINAFDLLRGWCLVVISSDHMMRFPSLFDPFTGRGLLWVTAAEGFFFISGALTGIVRGRKMRNEGLRPALKASWQRAGKLYAASVVLTLIFTVCAYWLTTHGGGEVKGGIGYFSSPWELLWKTLTLQYTYGWTDFLNYYVVYLLVAPVALWLCGKRRWWLVMIISLMLWVGKVWLGGSIMDAYLTWQIYFFMGLVFGFHYEQIHHWYRGLTEQTRRFGRMAVFTVTAITIVVSFGLTFGTPLLEATAGPAATITGIVRGIKDNNTFTLLLQNNRSGLLRPVVFMFWFGTLFYLVRRYESRIIERIGWLLLPLGKNSLYVYILQGVVVMAVAAANLPQGFVINTLINVGAVMLYWWAVRKRFLFSVIPR